MCLNILDYPKFHFENFWVLESSPRFQSTTGVHIWDLSPGVASQLRPALMLRNWWCYKRWKTLCGAMESATSSTIQGILEMAWQSIHIEEEPNPWIHFWVERWDGETVWPFSQTCLGSKCQKGPVGQTISLQKNDDICHRNCWTLRHLMIDVFQHFCFLASSSLSLWPWTGWSWGPGTLWALSTLGHCSTLGRGHRTRTIWRVVEGCQGWFSTFFGGKGTSIGVRCG